VRLPIATVHFLIVLVILPACKIRPASEAITIPEVNTNLRVPTATSTEQSGCAVISKPEQYSFDPFYKKYCDADGIPIISSGDVSDLAFSQAFAVIHHMLEPIPEVRQELIANGAYFGIIGMYERLTEMPEYANLDSQDLDKWARGLGGGKSNPFTTDAEENLLCLTWDRYYGENIAVHEFAHTISLAGLGANFEPMLEGFTELYKSALQKGLWVDTYAGSDIQEYWAEGVQDYFNTNLEAEPADGVHNWVNTRTELAEYDPAFYEFISKFFHGYEWTPTCPRSGP
jgi:hypothetical protein